MKPSTEEKKNLFLVCLKNTLGNISEACRMTGIGRQTYYDWINKDTAFQEKCIRVDESVIDWVESKMMEAIDKGDRQLIKFYLRAKARHRGYVDSKKLRHEYPDGVPGLQVNQQFNIHMPPQPETLAEWEAQVKELRAGRKQAQLQEPQDRAQEKDREVIDIEPEELVQPESSAA